MTLGSHEDAKTRRQPRRRSEGFDDAFDAVLEDGDVEVDEQPEFQLQGLQVRDDLRAVHAGEGFDRLAFDHQYVANENIDSTFTNQPSLVRDGERNLAL